MEICPLEVNGRIEELDGWLSLSTAPFKARCTQSPALRLVSVRRSPGAAGREASGLHQSGTGPGRGGIFMAMRQRQIAFRTHFDQPGGSPLELVRLMALGRNIQRQRIG